MSFLIEKYPFRGDCAITTAGDTSTVTGPCHFCRTPQKVHVKTTDLEKFRAGSFAQDCFPYLKPAEREFLISGICDPCWNSMFPPDEEEEITPEE
jgi:hypothetical protein